LILMEARVGIEPAYTELQTAATQQDSKKPSVKQQYDLVQINRNHHEHIFWTNGRI
jgi:hypothetical protein